MHEALSLARQEGIKLGSTICKFQVKLKSHARREDDLFFIAVMAGATLRCQVSVSSCDHLGERRREVFVKGIVVLKQFPAFNYL